MCEPDKQQPETRGAPDGRRTREPKFPCDVGQMPGHRDHLELLDASITVLDE